jgi:hypothetical protein
MRWAFLKKRHNWTKSQRASMRAIEGSTLRTLHAFLLVEAFQHFWTYSSATWAANSWMPSVRKLLEVAWILLRKSPALLLLTAPFFSIIFRLNANSGTSTK